MHRTRLCRVMDYCEQQRGVAPPANLTAVMLRDKYWKGVGRTGPRNHRQQLAKVFAMMRGDRDLGWGGEDAALPALIESEVRLAPAPRSGPTAAAEELLGLPAEDTGRSLPELYEKAKASLAELTRLEDCKVFADKVLALAAYARRARDPELRAYTQRVVAWATRRAGELLSEIPAVHTGRPPAEITQVDLSNFPTRQDAAAAAGLSRHQRDVALRLARIPPDEFARLVERPEPATIDELEAAGRAVRTGGPAPAPPAMAETPSTVEASDEDRGSPGEPWLPDEPLDAERPLLPAPQIDLAGRTPAQFRAATKLRGYLPLLIEDLKDIDAQAVLPGLDGADLTVIAAQLREIRILLDRIERGLGLRVDG
jgi:hypothetical protein